MKKLIERIRNFFRRVRDKVTRKYEKPEEKSE